MRYIILNRGTCFLPPRWSHHFQGWIQKFSGVEGVNTHFNSTHPTPKISTKIFQMKSGHSKNAVRFSSFIHYFSRMYIFEYLFIYFLREEDNDFLQIRVLWKLVNWLQMSPKPVHNLVPVFFINSEAFLNGLTGDPLHVTV